MELPLTHAQEWVLRYQHPTERLSVILEVGPAKGVEEIAGALSRLSAAHEALRVRLGPQEARTRRQRVEAAQSSSVELVQITVPGDDAALERACSSFAQQPLDRSSTVARAALLTGASARWLCLVVDHLVCDAWGIGVLASDLARLLSDGQADVRPRPQLSDVALGRKPPEEQENLRYWQERLAGLPATAAYASALTDQGQPPAQSLAFVLPAETTQRMRRFAAAHAIDPFEVHLCALTILAGGYMGQYRMVISNNFHNRRHRREMLAAANVFQRLYLPIDADGTETVLDRAFLVHEICLASYRRSAFSSCELHDWLARDAKRRGAWFRPALVTNHMGTGPKGAALASRRYPSSPLGEVRPLNPYWIDFAAHTRWLDQGLWVELRIGGPLLDARPIRLIKEDLGMVLRTMLADPAAAVASLPVPRLRPAGDTVFDVRSGTHVDPLLVERLIAGLPAVKDCHVAVIGNGGRASLRATVTLDALRSDASQAAAEAELRDMLHRRMEHARGALVPHEIIFASEGDARSAAR